MAEKLKINRLYAFIAEDDEGEGLCGFQTPEGQWMAMVGADKARMESLKPIARQIARESGQTIRLLCFSGREELERILPRTYAIQGQSITCLVCGHTSFNQNDVAQKYCAHCKRFHEN